MLPRGQTHLAGKLKHDFFFYIKMSEYAHKLVHVHTLNEHFIRNTYSQQHPDQPIVWQQHDADSPADAGLELQLMSDVGRQIDRTLGGR